MSLEERELLDLEKAVKLLEQATITEKMTQMVGKPIDYLMSKLPKGAEAQIYSLVEKALHKAADAALWSLNNEPNRDAYFHERRSLNNFHRDRVITFEQIAE
ncbi:hypothetical protein [Escherichia coli]|uniref:hypothetical protein n=1 Tax=Escherichia coli TaxID=562 RepID=UPI000CF0963A|nr:hypothetical protein [Escherichia coli]PQA15886.1 hypothetical protein C5F40_26330 [Escherichia coli]PQA17646.1 hypothetical protein C5F39_25390 [Escherichia coli]